MVAFQLFLILALRDVTLGVDLPNYSAGYKYISGLDFGDMFSRLGISGIADLVYPFSYENGYTVFNWVVSHIGFSFHAFLVVCAAINISSVSYFIYKYSKKPWLSFVIFVAFGFFVYDFGIIRQSLALSMILWSYILLDKKKYIGSIISFIMAFGFHRIAIIAIPLLFLSRTKYITKNKFIALLLLSLPLLLLSGVLYNNVVISMMSSMGKGYAGHDMIMNNMFMLLAGISLLVLFFYNFKNINNKIDSVSCFALIFAIYFSIIGLYNDNFARGLQFYSIFLVILIPAVLEQYKDQKIIHILEFLIFVLLSGFMWYSIEGSIIDPYIIYQGGLLG